MKTLSYDPPTTERIAMIAAILALGFGPNGRSNETNLALRRWHDPWKDVVRNAFAIWREVNIQMEDESMLTKVLQTRPDIFTFRDRDGDGCIGRETFLRRLLPKSKAHRTYDIGRIGRAFIRHLYLGDCKYLFQKEPDDKEFEAYYGGWKVPEKEANRLSIGFKRWYRKFIVESRRAAGLKSGDGKKMKKRL